MKDIFFDLDDTIFDFKKAEAIAMKTTLEHYGIEPTQDVIHLYSVINQSQWELLEKKLLTKNEVKIRRFKLFLDALMHTDYLRDAVCIGFIANEALSIAENAGLMGLPMPLCIRKGIDILKTNAENGVK